MKKIYLSLSVIIICFLFPINVFAAKIPEKVEENSNLSQNGKHEITIMAIGDNLMHMGIVRSGDQPDGTRNYDFLYDGIAPYLAEADIKIINQETPLAGNHLGFSGFPKFNSPTEVGDSIANVGFNVVLSASNHTADQDITGLLSMAEFWETSHPEVLVSGIQKEATELPELPHLTIDDTTIAILNYTYGPNMESFPKSLEGHMNLLCNYDKGSRLIDFTTINPQVINDIKRAKNLYDIVIVCPHWGTEYQTKQSGYQETFAKQMTEAGADLIIGTHPHVIQPVEWVTADNGNRALCYYSLGNYVSTQRDTISMLEAMTWVTFVKDSSGIHIEENKSGVVPLVCHYTSGPVRLKAVYPLSQYSEELAASHGIRNYGGVVLYYEELLQWADEILGEFVMDPVYDSKYRDPCVSSISQSHF